MRLTRGDLAAYLVLPGPRGSGTGGQKSAEAIVADVPSVKGRTYGRWYTGSPSVLGRCSQEGLKPEVAGGTRKVRLGAYRTPGDEVMTPASVGTAVYGTVRTVVWEDGGGNPPPTRSISAFELFTHGDSCVAVEEHRIERLQTASR